MEPGPARNCMVFELERKVRFELVECGKLVRMREEGGGKGEGREDGDEGTREGGRVEAGREGGRKRGRERREGGKKDVRKGGREGAKEGGKEGGREEVGEKKGYCMTIKLRVHVHEQSVIETGQSKATTPEDNSFFPQEKKKSCLRRDSNP